MLRRCAPSQLIKNKENNPANPNDLSPSFSGSCKLNSDENLPIINNIVNCPFKLPITNIYSSGRFKTLGIRNGLNRCSAHDPNLENALVLFTPPILSEHEKITTHAFVLPIYILD
ncbi:hypothetical protein HZS_4973 [Henneguya salminicola]|nr:hypothetical protein HZS_4973 [Henneguya salminicola]